MTLKVYLKTLNTNTTWSFKLINSLALKSFKYFNFIFINNPIFKHICEAYTKIKGMITLTFDISEFLREDITSLMFKLHDRC